MDATEHHLNAGAGLRSLTVGLAALCATAAATALAHMLETAQRGAICGISHAGDGHCWACHAAPTLALAAIVSWRLGKAAPRFINARI